MKIKNLIFLTLLPITEVIYAGVILSTVNNHPEVVIERAIWKEQGHIISIEKAKNNIRVKFKSESNFPLGIDITDSGYRISSENSFTTDLELSVNKVLYDFGKSELREGSEKSKSKVLRLKYSEKKELILLKLIKKINKYHESEQKIEIMKRNKGNILKTKRKIDLRDQAGIESQEVVRGAKAELESQTIELESEIIRKARIFSSISEEYGIKKYKIYSIIEKLTKKKSLLLVRVKSLIKENIISKSSERSISILNNTIESKDLIIKSIDANFYPEITGNLTGNLYDISSGLNEYRLFTGFKTTFELYDGGESELRKKQIEEQKKIEMAKFLLLQRENRLEIADIKSEILILGSRMEEMSNRLEGKIKSLSEYKEKLLVLGGSYLEVINKEISIARLQKELVSIRIEYETNHYRLLEKKDLLLKEFEGRGKNDR
jgi:outer membrane protein TolC